MLYEYTNKEYDLVKNAFRIGNWDSIRNLPTELKPFQVLSHIPERLQKEELHTSMIVQNKRVAKEILKDHGGLFNKFDYISEDYNQTAESEKKWREASKNAMITERPFYPIQTKRVVKYEYPFLGKDEVSTYAFLSQNDPYELTKDEKLRA